MENETYQESTCPCEWNYRIFHQVPDAEFVTCMLCRKIVEFRWKSIWKNIRNIFQLTK